MEIINQDRMTLMGKQVKGFPKGVDKVFHDLIQKFGEQRNYYGISWCEKDNSITYYAMTPESKPGEAKDQHLVSISVEKGKYKSESVHNWRDQIECIKDTFHKLMGDKMPTKENPAIEWYKSDKEMICMIKA